jgi:hypothetical protein
MSITKGPWAYFIEDDEYVVDVADERKPRNSSHPFMYIEVARIADQEEAKADAHAISAVPEMMEALEDCVKALSSEESLAYYFQAEISKAKQALAKAKGESDES